MIVNVFWRISYSFDYERLVQKRDKFYILFLVCWKIRVKLINKPLLISLLQYQSGVLTTIHSKGIR